MQVTSCVFKNNANLTAQGVLPVTGSQTALLPPATRLPLHTACPLVSVFLQHNGTEWRRVKAAV